MGSINNILSIARTALAANQRAVEVISHNIANASTEGYSKQRIEISPRTPLVTAEGIFGTGVDSTTVVRLEDRFITDRVNTETMNTGKWLALERSLRQVEFVFTDRDDTGLSMAINEFFNAAENLSTNPESLSARSNLVQRAESMTQSFNSAAAQLRDAQRMIDYEIRTRVSEINMMSQNIADISEAIIRSEAGGNRANDLRDQRDQMVNKISELTDLEIIEKKDGHFLLSMDGNLIVDGTVQRDIVIQQISTGYTAFSKLTIEGATTELTVLNGEIGGLLEARDSKLAGYLADLDSLARKITTSVNEVHKTGFGLNGTTGTNFFVASAEGAVDMAVDEAVLNDVTKIAAADGYDSDLDGIKDMSNGPGDNTIIKSIAALRNIGLMGDGVTTFGEYYGNIMGNVGFDNRQAQDMMKSQVDLTAQLINMRDSIVGVSVDEELANMITFQNNYAAAARVFRIVDEMLQSILAI